MHELRSSFLAKFELTNWTKQSKHGNIQIMKRKDKPSIYLATCFVDCPLESLLDLLSPGIYFLTLAHSFEQNAVVSFTNSSFHVKIPKSEFTNKQRDCFIQQHVFKDGDSADIISTSVDSDIHSDSLEVIDLMGWKLRTVNSKVQVSFLLQESPRSYVSSSLCKPYMLSRVRSCLSNLVLESLKLDIVPVKKDIPPQTPPQSPEKTFDTKTDLETTFESITTSPKVLFSSTISSSSYPDHKYTSYGLEALASFKALLLSDKWVENGTERGVKISMLDEDGKSSTGVPIVRGEAVWKAEGKGNPVNNILCVITSKEARSIWDPRFEKGILVDWIDPLNSLTHSYQKGTFPVSGRDLFSLQSRYYDKDTDSTYLIHTSVDPTSDHEPTSSHVRAHLFVAGWKIEPIDDGYKVNYLVHVDPKGAIPTRLLKLVAVQTPLCIAGVFDFIESYGFPMKPSFLNVGGSAKVKLISENNVGNNLQVVFDLSVEGIISLTDGLIQFNICQKLYPLGCDVLCENIDLVDIVVSSDGLYLRCYPKRNLEFLKSIRITIRVSKRVLSNGRRSVDFSHVLNGGLMPVDDRVLQNSESTPSIFKPVYKPELPKTTKTVFKPQSKLRRPSRKLPIAHSHSTSTLANIIIYTWWILIIVLAPFSESNIRLLFTVEAVEFAASFFTIARLWIAISDRHLVFFRDSGNCLLIGYCWVIASTIISFLYLDPAVLLTLGCLIVLNIVYFNFVDRSYDRSWNEFVGKRYSLMLVAASSAIFLVGNRIE